MCVDTFSYSRKFERAFQKMGFAAISFDVKNSDAQDITSPSGFRLLLDMILQQLSFKLKRQYVCCKQTMTISFYFTNLLIKPAGYRGIGLEQKHIET